VTGDRPIRLKVAIEPYACRQDSRPGVENLHRFNAGLATLGRLRDQLDHAALAPVYEAIARVRQDLPAAVTLDALTGIGDYHSIRARKRQRNDVGKREEGARLIDAMTKTARYFGAGRGASPGLTLELSTKKIRAAPACGAVEPAIWSCRDVRLRFVPLPPKNDLASEMGA
jgi:hypothetical protein